MAFKNKQYINIFKHYLKYKMLIYIIVKKGNTMSSTLANIAIGGTLLATAGSVAYVVATPNHAPIAKSQSVITKKNQVKSIVLNAQDSDGDVLSYTIINQPKYGKLSGAYPNVVYTPKVNYTGSDKFTFKANDGKVNSNLATVSINISNFNNAPVAYEQNLTLLKNKSLIITLNATDVDKDALSYKIIQKTSHGTLSQNGAKVTYTPTKDFIGEDYFTFRANDGSKNSLTKKISLKINDDVVFLRVLKMRYK